MSLRTARRIPPSNPSRYSSRIRADPHFSRYISSSPGHHSSPTSSQPNLSSKINLSPSVPEPKHSDILTRATALLSTSWTLSPSGTALQRTFRFKTFKRTWSFMNAVAEEAGRRRHHPEWCNVYDRVMVRWTTHVPRGLGEGDVGMAEFCDRVAGEMGEVVRTEESRAEDRDVFKGLDVEGDGSCCKKD